jgi:phage FluMu gp28-like protein
VPGEFGNNAYASASLIASWTNADSADLTRMVEKNFPSVTDSVRACVLRFIQSTMTPQQLATMPSSAFEFTYDFMASSCPGLQQ